MSPARNSGTIGLRRAASRAGLLFGAAVSSAELESERQRRAVMRDCCILAPEYELKWDKVSSAPGVVDFAPAERIAAFAAVAGMAFRGHTIWWHEAVPTWLKGAPPGTFADAALGHLTTTLSHFAGRMHSWDVVNEPLHLDDGRQDGLRASPFLAALGPDYLGLAFRAAADLDPGAILVLNEMGLEYASPTADAKRRAMLRLLERELAAGTPIHALGLQSHLDAMDQPRRHPALKTFLREITALGLRVMVTEMDVSDAGCPRDLGERDRLVAETYQAHLDLVLDACPTLSVLTWGLSDGKTWLSSARPRVDGARVRPLPLDRVGRRKPAWHALAAVLAHGPRVRTG